MQRRRFLSMSARSTLAAGAVAATGYGFGYEPSALTLERVDLPLRGLPPDFDGVTIALLTDLHAGPYTSKSFLVRAVAMAMQESADLVLLGGDYVHHGGRYFAACAEAASALRAPLGVFAVTGNHDHWDGIDECMRQFSATSVKFLRNHNVPLERGKSHLWLAGVDDLWNRTIDPVLAVAGIPKGDFTVLLSHNPDLVELLPPGIEPQLMLSGHTHGGQVRIPLFGAPVVPSRHGQKYISGRAEKGATTVYTSRGIGTISPPVRVNCPPEVSLLRLRAS